MQSVADVGRCATRARDVHELVCETVMVQGAVNERWQTDHRRTDATSGHRDHRVLGVDARSAGNGVIFLADVAGVGEREHQRA